VTVTIAVIIFKKRLFYYNTAKIRVFENKKQFFRKHVFHVISYFQRKTNPRQMVEANAALERNGVVASEVWFWDTWGGVGNTRKKFC
jgi:hypothetical protein